MIDLHTHSTASDGSLSPAHLVQQAASVGIKTLALTDHDSIAGIAEAREAAFHYDIHLVSGIELSVTWSKRSLHLLGLKIDECNKELLDALAKALELRRLRAINIALKLEREGVVDALEGACKFATSGLIGRAHFAHYLVEQGHAKDIRQVFKRYMVKGKPGHVSGAWMSLEVGVNLIHAAGGVAVLAHPARYKLSRSKLRSLFKEFKQLGGEGIEVVSGCHSQAENHTMALHALDLQLAASQGSDFHGPEKPWVQLGRLPALYYRCTPIWEAGLQL